MASHEDGPVLTYGAPLEAARSVMVMLHGRGATAEDILALAPLFAPEGMAFLAPQAANNTWYPYRFVEPLERNEPWLSAALGRVGQMVGRAEQAGVPQARIYLLGFSQGACLALEYAARRAGRYGGVIGLSGGLIGADDAPRDYPGSMAGTPVFLGCSDVDFHIPKARVTGTADVFRRLGADVTLRLYPQMGHTVNDDEIAFIKQLLAA